uniref:Uncharacterized protein n=1 Tax=Anguilla anguilla TaxID=7936 RepID=A0A0E9RQH3_ANGAN
MCSDCVQGIITFVLVSRK